jgi:thioredoxin reductase (NADPH)
VIDRLEREADGTFKLIGTNGEMHRTRKIILAVGRGTFKENKLQLERAAQFEGTGLFYAVRHKQQFAGKKIVISGGGGGALDWAAELAPVCRQVTLVYRGREFTHALEHQVTRLKRHAVDVKLAAEIVALSGSEKLESVTVRASETGKEETLRTDALIVNHGFQFGLGGIERWGLSIKDFGIVVDQRMETSVKGIFAIGNAASYPQKFYLIAAGFAEGPTAINGIKQDLDPNAPPQAMVSTHHARFTEND